jgi:hypothetical protein
MPEEDLQPLVIGPALSGMPAIHLTDCVGFASVLDHRFAHSPMQDACPIIGRSAGCRRSRQQYRGQQRVKQNKLRFHGFNDSSELEKPAGNLDSGHSVSRLL